MKRNISIRFKDGKFKVVTLSYDDGQQYDKKMIEILDKYNMKCTFNLNDIIDEKRIPKNEYNEVYKNHEIAVHGVAHVYPNSVPSGTFAYEIIENRRSLEEATGRIVKGMAYAYGSYTDECVEVLKACNIKYARTTKKADNFELPENWFLLNPTAHHFHEDLFEKCDKFLALERPEFKAQDGKMFYLWGHSYEFGRPDDWSVLEKFCEKMGNRDDIWYATNIELFDYVEAFKRLDFNVDCSMVYNPSAIPVWFQSEHDTIKVNPGETVSF